MAKEAKKLGAVAFLELRRRCPKNQLNKLRDFFQKVGWYQENLRGLKTEFPPTDWEFYKRHVNPEDVARIDEYESKLENFKVPYPKDIYSERIDKMKEKIQVEIDAFKKQSNERIAVYEKEIARINALVPYTQMTWEDYCNTYPEDAPDFINRPTFWPHTDEEQIETKIKKDKIKEEGKETKKCFN